jgi:hypothetical protein
MIDLETMVLHLDNHQYTAILRLHRLWEWHSQKGAYLVHRPPFNIKYQ